MGRAAAMVVLWWKGTIALTATTLTALDPPPVSFLVFCPACRRLQPPARTSCTGCGAAAGSLRHFGGDLAALAPRRVGHTVRYPGDTRFVTVTMAGAAALFALALALSGHRAADFALILMFTGVATAAVVDARRAAQAARDVRRVPPPAAALAIVPGTRAIAGVAEPLERFVDAPLAGGDCLAVRLDLRAGIHGAPPHENGTAGAGKADEPHGHDIVAQWIDAAEFVVATARGARTIVTGAIYLEADEYDLAERSDRAVLELHGHVVQPSPLGGDGWACELTLGPGDRVEICGHSTGEVRVAPAGALYRDAGALAVIRGEPGDPVIVRVRRR